LTDPPQKKRRLLTAIFTDIKHLPDTPQIIVGALI